MPLLGHPGLVIRACAALALANVRYWRTVAPLVRGELCGWRVRARAIVDPQLRSLALAKLDGEGFNAEAGAMLATFAPPAHRGEVVEAVVALQVLFDLLDGLTERPSADPLAEGERLFEIFTDAVSVRGQADSKRSFESEDYMQALSGAARRALEQLPGVAEVIEIAQGSAQRAAQAQTRMHAVPVLGTEQLRVWAQEQGAATGLAWREFAAGGASSVLAVHALLAAAGNRAILAAEAQAIDRAYLSICVLLTLLDSLTDRDEDARAGELGYAGLYERDGPLAQALATSSERALAHVRELPRAAEHLMILTAVVAYYGSAPGARDRHARPHVAALGRQLQPLIFPTLLVMRSWRLARRMRGAP
jgi:tetraprenyl-beta-curcumene synthase